MPRLLTFALFLSIMITLTGSAHYYVWSRLVRDPGLPASVTRALSYALIVLFVAIPASLFLRRSAFGGTATGLVWLAMIWLGLLLFLTLAVGVADLVRGLWQVSRAWSDPATTAAAPASKRATACRRSGSNGSASPRARPSCQMPRPRSATPKVKVKKNNIPSQVIASQIRPEALPLNALRRRNKLAGMATNSEISP